MKMRFLTCLAAAALCAAVTSCSDSDEATASNVGIKGITLNMLNEANGQTYLGNTNIYIDKANNFVGNETTVSTLGAASDLISVAPVVDIVDSKAAVVAGYLYHLFPSRALIEFPSGKNAARIDASYCAVYVVSTITDNGKMIGAQVRYAILSVPDYGMPAFDTTIGSMENAGDILTVDLPSADFEWVTNECFEVTKQGTRLTVRLTKVDSDTYPLYVRIGSSYTRLLIEIK